MPDRDALVEVAAIQVEAAEAPQQWQRVRWLPCLLELDERSSVDVLDLLGVPTDRHEAARQARSHHDLLGGVLRRRRRRGEHGEQVVRERDRSVVPTSVVVQRPQCVEHRVESPEVAGLHPVAPRGAQVAEVGIQLGEDRRTLPCRSGGPAVRARRRRSAPHARAVRRRVPPAARRAASLRSRGSSRASRAVGDRLRRGCGPGSCPPATRVEAARPSQRRSAAQQPPPPLRCERTRTPRTAGTSSARPRPGDVRSIRSCSAGSAAAPGGRARRRRAHQRARAAVPATPPARTGRSAQPRVRSRAGARRGDRRSRPPRRRPHR